MGGEPGDPPAGVVVDGHVGVGGVEGDLCDELGKQEEYFTLLFWVALGLFPEGEVADRTERVVGFVPAGGK